MDGFVSAAAPRIGGELVTKPLTFQGGRLQLNFSTSAAGWVKVEVQDPAGHPVPGFSEVDADHAFGDTIERTVTWKGSTDISSLAGQPVRLRFVLRDADVYAFEFK
jgi:hypothetical protein